MSFIYFQFYLEYYFDLLLSFAKHLFFARLSAAFNYDFHPYFVNLHKYIFGFLRFFLEGA
jgi:hypothetical protein